MYRKIIKVFLGSPGDLEEERKAAKLIVDEENANHANNSGYHIDLVGWEDTVSQRRRAQEAINIDLDQCEYFVGLLWKKWGTPPGPKGHQYTSGFEEEYRRSVERHERSGKPEISLLFKTISSDDLVDIGKQLEKVLAFHEEINNAKNQYYQKFQDLREFEQRFRAIIAKFLRDQQREDAYSELSASQRPKPLEAESKIRKDIGDTKKIFEEGALEFISNFTSREEKSEAYTAAEAARFRLIASTVNRAGNDGLVLGTHDANLIYRHLRNADLTEREKRGLLAAGLENLDSSTVPMWHWLFKQKLIPESELALRTIVGSDKIRRNAFKMLGMLAISPPDFRTKLDNQDIISIWFSENTADDVVVAALEYLGLVADDKLEVDWQKLIGSSEANISRAAVRAQVRITLRTSITDALQIVAEHENTDLGTELAADLTSNISAIETSVLRKCLRNKTLSFLRVIANELHARAELTQADVQFLCDNSDAKIRLIGVRTMSKAEPSPTLSDAQKILIKAPGKSMGLLGSADERDYAGETAFENYKISVLERNQLHSLREMQKNESFYSSEVTLATFGAHFKQTEKELTVHLLDGFQRFCEERRKPLVGTSAEPSSGVTQYIRNSLLQSALELFCTKANKSGLLTVRTVLDKYEIKFSPEISDYFSKYGSWEDSSRLASLSRNPKYTLGSWLTAVEEHSGYYRLAAQAILKLGSTRIADTWKLDVPAPVRVQFITQMPKKLFMAFDNGSIVEMLLSESEEVREAVALKAVFCLSKARITALLSSYFEVEGRYFYNAIFWLDLGVSADHVTSQNVVRRELLKKAI